MQTFTGKKFWPLDPRPEDVHIEDIAHALSLLCRFNGHCNEFYSVAQHSVLVSQIVSPTNSLPALLHDASEAYLGDIIRPVKLFLPVAVKEIERKLEAVIFQHFAILAYDQKEISRADNIILYTEMRDLMGEPPEVWREAEQYSSLVLQQKILPLDPKASKLLFFSRYRELVHSLSG